MVLYYIVYGFLYTLSLLPLRVLYLLSDFAFFILYRIMKYRQEVVLNNLAIAFPEKSLQERQKIAKEFYGNANDYMRIFNANKDKLKDPNQIQVGQELKIPAA